jgi:hypothetical protein
MKKLSASILITLACSFANAEWLCNNPYQNSRKVESGWTGKTRVEKSDLRHAYSGQPILLSTPSGKSWVTACVMSADSYETKTHLGLLRGVSPESAERLARNSYSNSSVIDRGLFLVKNSYEMNQCLRTNQPSIGYGVIPQGGVIEACFD